MATDSCVLDAMDKLWFCQNIIFFEPDVVSLQSKLTTPISIASPSSPDENPNRQSSAYKDKTPTRLNIVIGQPLFQLQPPPKNKIQSHSSSPSLNTGQVKPPTLLRSLSELENYELKGFMDLGFTFPKDKPSSYMMSMLPGLQRLDDKDERRVIRRPYLSEAWLVNSTDSPLINLQLLSKTPDGAVMKKHLRFWAQRVAMLVHEEP